jgi:hypothetical protein
MNAATRRKPKKEFPMGNYPVSDPVVSKAKQYVLELTASSECGHLIKALLVSLAALRLSSQELHALAADTKIAKNEWHKLRMVGDMLLPICGGDEVNSRRVIDSSSPWGILSDLPDIVKGKYKTTSKHKLQTIYKLHEAAPEAVDDFVVTHDVGEIKIDDLPEQVASYMEENGIERVTKGGRPKKKSKQNDKQVAPESSIENTYNQLNFYALEISTLFGNKDLTIKAVKERLLITSNAMKAGLFLLDVASHIADDESQLGFQAEGLGNTIIKIGEKIKSFADNKLQLNKTG